MKVRVTPGMVRSWLCREGDATPPFTMEELAEAYLLNVQRYVQMQDAIEESTKRYQESQEMLKISISKMEPGSIQHEEANRYVGYINIFIQSLVGITLSSKHAGDWVREYIKGWKESLEEHKRLHANFNENLLKDQSELVQKTDFAFGTLRELRDYNPTGVTLESYKKQVKEAASIALQRIEGIRIQ